MVGHCEGKELLSAPILPEPPDPHVRQEGGMLHSSPRPTRQWVFGTGTASQARGQGQHPRHRDSNPRHGERDSIPGTRMAFQAQGQRSRHRNCIPGMGTALTAHLHQVPQPSAH